MPSWEIVVVLAAVTAGVLIGHKALDVVKVPLANGAGKKWWFALSILAVIVAIFWLEQHFLGAKIQQVFQGKVAAEAVQK